MIASITQRMVRTADAAVAGLYLAFREERSALLSFLFHSLFRDEKEIALNLIDPLERTTVAHLRRFIEYYLGHGYRFISPADLLNGLGPEGKYAMITFDDGYYNNTLALPVLEEFDVPAVFYISTDNVRQNKLFWWDVVYRQRMAEGVKQSQIRHEQQEMKSLRTEEIEARLIEQYGADAFRPRGDVDRPFSPDDLREFSRHKHVRLGNHTANHAILTNYTPQQVRDQVVSAQQFLHDLTGSEPISIAYPNGAHSDQVIDACAGVGLRIGFTVRPEKNLVPLHADSPALLRLGRFCPTTEGRIDAQYRTYRSDVLIYGKVRDWYLRLVRGQVAQ